VIALLAFLALGQTVEKTIAAKEEILPRVVVTVHLDQVIGPISPYIYGTNDDRSQAWTAAKRHTMGRLGGNRWTAYNWETNASNAGNDWHHQNDGYLSKSDEPARAVTDRLDVIQKHGAPVLVTVPIQGWVAADKKGDGDVAKSGKDYLKQRFVENRAWNPNPTKVFPNLTDGAVFQDEFVRFLEARRQRNHAPTIWYSLDNEPDLWRQTHARIQSAPLDRKAFFDRSIQFAKAVKREAPDALVFGPAVSGWMGITTGGAGKFDRQHYFIDDYLDAFNQMRPFDRGPLKGKPLLDVLDVHWYPEHRSEKGVRVTSDSGADDVTAARAQAPRSLYDRGFRENSWITNDVLHQPIALLSRLQDSIARHHRDAKLAVTEYYFAGGADPSGAVAQADVLGAFGRYGIFAANLFHIGRTDDRYILAAFDLYRNYDGQGGRFGDQSLWTEGGDDMVSAYAATEGSLVTVVLINREGKRAGVRLDFTEPVKIAAAKRYQVAAPTPRPVEVEAVNLGDLVLPPMSATMIVVPR